MMATGTTDTPFSRTKKYTADKGATDRGRSFENKILAFIALRCLLEEFVDLQIATNAKGFNPFDDVVVTAQTKSGDDIRIFLQLKHKNEETRNFSKEEKYSLPRYYNHTVKLQQEFKKWGIFEDWGMLDNTHFVIFTNLRADTGELLKDDCAAISFLSTNNTELYKYRNNDRCHKLYFFAKQSHENHLQTVIENEMAKVFEHYGLTHRDIKNDSNIKNISKSFIDYVTEWSLGKLGDHYYLTNYDILCKLTELLISAYEVKLNLDIVMFYGPEEKLWNEIVNGRKITIVDSDERVNKFLKLYIGSEIQPYLCKLEVTWGENFSTDAQKQFYKKNQKLTKGMLKLVGNYGQVTLLSIYKCLWFNECVPLLLQTKTVEDYENILKILKLCNNKLKVIIVTEVKLTSTNTERDYFATLFDLNDENRLKVLNHPVKLNGRSSVILNDLICDHLYPLINCNAIINMIDQNFDIGTAYRTPPEYIYKRSLPKMFLKMDEHETFLHYLAKLYETDGRENFRNKIAEFVDKIPGSSVTNTTDPLDYTALEYALNNGLFALANKLCKKSPQLPVNTNKVDIYKIYRKNRSLISHKYKSLSNTILPSLICQVVLERGLLDDAPITNFFIGLPEALEIINEYANKFDLKSISDFLVKMNIQSPDRTKPYYYDLRFAAAFGSLRNVRDLIVSEQNKLYTSTPLYYAIKHNRLEIVTFLILYKKNININQPCARDLTPLHCAAQNGNIEIVQVLLLLKANVDVQRDNGDSPLNLAICGKHIEVAKLLIAYNARVNLSNNINCFPIYYAAAYGLDNLIPDLTKDVDINHRGIYDISPLVVAITNRHVKTVRELFNCGADCNIPDKSNNLPIHVAVEEGLVEILPDILSKNPQGVNSKNKEGQTPLHLSFIKAVDSREGLKNRDEVVNILLNKSADPNIQDCKGNTVLHYLFQYKMDAEDANVVELLFKKGANASLKNKLDNTAMNILLCNHHSTNYEVCKLIWNLFNINENIGRS